MEGREGSEIFFILFSDLDNCYHRIKSCDRVVTLWFFIKKGLTAFSRKSLFLLARPKRFERSTDGFVVR